MIVFYLFSERNKKRLLFYKKYIHILYTVKSFDAFLRLEKKGVNVFGQKLRTYFLFKIREIPLKYFFSKKEISQKAFVSLSIRVFLQ